MPQYESAKPERSFQPSQYFLAPDADALIRSSDNVTFHVSQAKLRDGSEFFAGLLALPQHDSSTEPITVPWDEPAKTVDSLLQFIYPVAPPIVDSIDELFELIRAADKWLLDEARASMMAQLLRPDFVDTYPLKIYVFLCDMDYDNKEDLAAKASKCSPLSRERRPLIRNLSALDLLRLIKCETDRDKPFDQCFSTSQAAQSHTDPAMEKMVSAMVDFFTPEEADFIIVSTDGASFPSMKSILQRSSDILREKIDMCASAQSSSSSPNHSTFSWDEPAETIAALLHFVYPVRKSELFRNVDDVIVWTEAAAKWDIPAALEPLLEHLMQPAILSSHALPIYALMCRMDRDVEKLTALRYATVNDPLAHPVKSDFNCLSALQLIDLINLRKIRLSEAQALVLALELPSIQTVCKHKKKGSEATAILKIALLQELSKCLSADTVGPAQVVGYLVGGMYCSQCMSHLQPIIEAALVCFKAELQEILGG